MENMKIKADLPTTSLESLEEELNNLRALHNLKDEATYRLATLNLLTRIAQALEVLAGPQDLTKSDAQDNFNRPMMDDEQDEEEEEEEDERPRPKKSKKKSW